MEESKKEAAVTATSRFPEVLVWLWNQLNYPDCLSGRCGQLVFNGYQQTKILQSSLRSDFTLVTARGVYNLSEFDKLIVRRNRPENIDFSRGHFLQLMEPQLHFRRSILARRDENIRARAGHGAAEIKDVAAVMPAVELAETFSPMGFMVCGITAKPSGTELLNKTVVEGS